jgi:hypothetical protein
MNPRMSPADPREVITVVLVYSTTHVHFKNEIGHFNYGIMFDFSSRNAQHDKHIYWHPVFFLPLHYYLFG